MAHTPGLLYINHDMIKSRWTENGQEDSAIICRVIFDRDKKANAERIVESWNNYDQLKAENEALKVLLGRIYYQIQGELLAHRFDAVIGEIKAIIDKQ